MPSVFLLFLGCPDQNVGIYNTPPSVSITSPTDGAIIAPGDTLELAGVAQDDQVPETLLVTWSSSLDGELGTSSADSDGIVKLAVTDLSAGTHAITLMAVDQDGESGDATITIDVGYGGNVEGAPVISLIGPVDGEEIPASQGVTVVGSITDDEQAWDTLDVAITSSRDGLLWEGAPASTGGISVPLSGLSVGAHTLVVNAEDDDAHVSEATVGITILEDARPVVSLTSPTDGRSYWTTDTFTLGATVSDDLDAPEDLVLELESDAQGVVWTGSATSSGQVSGSFSLGEALHTLTLYALDTEGNEGSDSIQVEVIDPDNYDNDGDGYTENEGDCDDSEPNLNPGETEVCDGVDQNCDGQHNEPWHDSYEPNDDSSSYYDLGEVDASWLWDGSALKISALTMSAPTDEDWFYFDVDDQLYDNASFNVQITGLPTAGRWVIELYDMNGGSPSLVDSESGNGAKMTVYFEGDWTDSGEDNWAVRIYPTTWKTSGCTQTYTLKITT